MTFQHKFYLDVNRDGTYGGASDISDYVENADWFFGLNDMWGQVAPRANLTITVNNSSGVFSQQDPDALYYNKLTYNTLIKVAVYYNGAEITLCVLRVDSIVPINNTSYGEEWQYQISCSDVVPSWLDEPVNIPLQQNVRVDEALTTLFNQNIFIYPYESAFFFIDVDEIDGDQLIYDYQTQNLVDFDESYQTITFVGDNLDRGQGTNAKQFVSDLMQVERTGIFFWDARNEQFKFYNRWHHAIASNDPYTAKTVSALFTQEHINSSRMRVVDVINVLNVEYYPRKIGEPNSLIAQKRGLPFPFRGRDTQEFNLRYYDPDVPSALVGGVDVINPTIGVDIIANSKDDGTGEDWTRFVIFKSFFAYSDHCVLTVFNRKVGDPAYITDLNIYGTPIISYQKEQITYRNSLGIYNYGKRVRTDSVRLLDSKAEAEAYAQFWSQVFSNDSYVYSEITIKIKTNSEDWLIEQVLNRTIGDLITIRNKRFEDENYYIIGESHSAVPDEGIHTVTYMVRPVETYQPFIIDSSEIDGNHFIV